MTETAAPFRLFCFGFGFSARALARRLAEAGWAVAGTTRSREKAAELRAAGVEAYLFDRAHPLDPAALAGTTHLLVSIAPDGEGGRAGDPVLDRHAADIAALPRLEWIGYLSTTGVYGDWQGAEVDETSELRGAKGRNLRRIEAEAAWLRLQEEEGLPVHVFRLAGIYGPGRSVLDQVRAGRARRIDKPGHLFSRIHVEDIAKTLQASMARPHPGRVYNVCDDEAAAAAEVTAYACGLLGVEPPPLIPLEEAEMSPMALSFWEDNRLVSNRRLHEELGVALDYPNYRAGLEAILAED
ncbi:SDR family oxidoreductase [Pelagibius marinus]|uniref:SDR family oxidoreductase n=1 Tax=Pelagibius marinus TaxID=2762760 RepID=UPI0018728A2A|nr:SDR family oxidoreductase [Pelagibius marinus]